MPPDGHQFHAVKLVDFSNAAMPATSASPPARLPIIRSAGHLLAEASFTLAAYAAELASARALKAVAVSRMMAYRDHFWPFAGDRRT